MFAFSQTVSADTAADILSKIPVQHGGRVKPFESFAAETVLYLTGKSRFEGFHPTDLIWQWLAEPEEWNTHPMIPVTLKPLQEEFSRMVIRGRVSPEIVMNHKPFLEKAEAALRARRKKETLLLVDQKRLEIYERARLFREIGEGAVPGWVPHPEDPRLPWFSFQPFAGVLPEEGPNPAVLFPAEKIQQFKKATSELLIAYREDPSSAGAAQAATEFSRSLRELLESRGIVLDEKTIGEELVYNRLKPFGWAWKFYALSAMLIVILSLPFGRQRISEKGSFVRPLAVLRMTSIGLFLAGFAVHSYGFYLRCAIAGRPPVTNMYESIIWVSWAIAFFSGVLFAVYRAPSIPITAALVASFALVLAESLPLALDPAISPLVPVLRSNWWLTIHVLTITLSYGAFALAWGLGHAVVFRFAWPHGAKENLDRLSTYLYRALQIGVILLAAGTILGGVWASFSWGRFWGWDPKETWALIALLGYLTVLHGRFTGWLGPFGIAMGSVIAFLGVLIAWYGVNFVLAAGLHSYGFGGGGLPYALAAVALDFCILAAAAWAYKKRISNPMSVR